MIYGKIFAYFCMGKDIFGVRADVFLATNGYAKSRQRAQEMIRAGLVLCGGKPIIKPSEQLGTQAKITVLGEVHPYVGRGGVKLEKALRRFSVDPAGRRCCDIGASTGGFTDCLLRRGAAFVYAVDSGTAGSVSARRCACLLHGKVQCKNAEPTAARRQGFSLHHGCFIYLCAPFFRGGF